jgi:hypothetical protein
VAKWQGEPQREGDDCDMSKRRRKKRNAVRISPESALRPRLDRLWAEGALLHKDDGAVEGDLDVLARDVAPDFLVETMLRAYTDASVPVRARLNDVLPGWLSRHDHLSLLKEMVVEHALAQDLRSTAVAWMEAAGLDTRSLDRVPSPFLRAYYYDDTATLGEKSQAYVAVFWYAGPRKNRAQGLSFLLDYNPPWDGSVKDVLLTPRRHPERLIRDFLDVWVRGGMEPEIVSAERAKTVIVTALNCNRAARLRLPRDLIAAREEFVRYVLSLPDGPDTPAFVTGDFNFLARNGKLPEKIVQFEQTVGRRVRTEDGKEILVMGGPDWDEEW